jgi:hypothetical protein
MAAGLGFSALCAHARSTTVRAGALNRCRNGSLGEETNKHGQPATERSWASATCALKRKETVGRGKRNGRARLENSGPLYSRKRLDARQNATWAPLFVARENWAEKSRTAVVEKPNRKWILAGGHLGRERSKKGEKKIIKILGAMCSNPVVTWGHCAMEQHNQGTKNCSDLEK